MTWSRRSYHFTPATINGKEVAATRASLPSPWLSLLIFAMPLQTRKIEGRARESARRNHSLLEFHEGLMKCAERGDRSMGYSKFDMEKLLSQKAIAQHGDGLKEGMS